MRKRWIFLTEVLVMLIACAAIGYFVYKPTPEGCVDMKVGLDEEQGHVLIQRNPEGKLRYIGTMIDGTRFDLSPEQWSERVYLEKINHKWWYPKTLLNVTSPVGYVWVALGFIGQVVFTGRMVVQLIFSEREKKSVVPPVFWWMSLIGSTMLLVYFVWRMDAVGITGQAFGWFIYIRNLWLIYGQEAPAAPVVQQTPVPKAT